MPYARGKPSQGHLAPAYVCSVQNISFNHVVAAGTTGITITKPVGVLDFDVLYACISRTSYASTVAWTCSGWTDISPATQGTTTGNDRQMTILRKVISDASAEPASYTFVAAVATSYQICGMIVRVTGANKTTPEDIAVPAYGTTTNHSNPASLDGTSVTAGALVLQFLLVSLGTNAQLTWGAPSGYTDGGNVYEGTGSLDNQTGVAYKNLAGAGSTAGTNAWTNNDDGASESLTGMVMVRPRTT